MPTFWPLAMLDTWAWALRICDKYQNFMCRPTWPICINLQITAANITETIKILSILHCFTKVLSWFVFLSCLLIYVRAYLIQWGRRRGLVYTSLHNCLMYLNQIICWLCSKKLFWSWASTRDFIFQSCYREMRSAIESLLHYISV